MLLFLHTAQAKSAQALISNRRTENERLVFGTLILLTTAYLAYVAILVFLSPANFPENMQAGGRFPFLCDKPLDEDGYYMLTIAHQIARGHGIVYNFDQPTTGIQPLAAFVFAIVAYPVQLLDGDRWTFIRAIVMLGGLNLLLFGHLSGVITAFFVQKQKPFAYALAFVSVVFNFNLFRVFTYGLETGLYLTLFSLLVLKTLHLSHKREPLSYRDAVRFGIFAGTAAWARIDFGVLLLFFLLTALLFRQLCWRWAALCGIVAAMVIAPWLIYVRIVSGDWFPSSGAAQAGLISSDFALHRMGMMIQALAGQFVPWLYTRPGGLPLIVVLISLILWVVAVFHPKPVRAHTVSMLSGNRLLGCWWISGVILASIYVVSFSSVHFYHRYVAPLTVPVVAVSIFAIIERIDEAPHAYRKLFRVAVIASFLFCFCGWAFFSFHRGRIGNTHAVTAGFIKEHFSEAKIGAFQSGVIGYFNPNVVNLDGKVNPEALHARAADRLSQYIDREGIQVIVDWPEYIFGALDREWLKENWRPCDVPVLNNASICLVRKSGRPKIRIDNPPMTQIL